MSNKKLLILKISLLSFIIVFFCSLVSIFAKDLTINTGYFYSNNSFYAEVQNASQVELPVKEIAAKFAGEIKSIKVDHAIPPGSSETFQLPFTAPVYGGSFNLSVWVIYLNDDVPLSVIGNQLFNFDKPYPIYTVLNIKPEHIRRQGKITVEFQNPDYIPFTVPVLPIELQIKSVKTNGNILVYNIINYAPTFNNNYTAYWVIEKNEVVNGAPIRAGAYFPVTITTGGGTPTFLNWNFPSFELLTAIWIISLLLLIILSNRYYHGESKKKPVMYFIFYLFIFNFIASLFQLPNLIIGSNYDYFRDLLFPFYYIGVIVYGIFSTNKLFKASDEERESILSNRKVWLMFSFFEGNIKAIGKDKGHAVPFDGKVRTAFLSIAVKFFFLPLLSSWAISNVFHISNLIRNFRLDFYYINRMLIDIFILFDTSVFAFSYAVESKRLKSEIRSVEPTLIGWIVCLWCYPPFNSFSFSWLAYLLPYKPSIVLPEWGLMLVLGSIAFLWWVYVMATISLGLKSSNLTNRGTVDKFPYNLIRHPAYASKNLLWILGFLFLSNAVIPYGQYEALTLGQTIGSCVIYYLRARTEERHLSMDPDYLQYKQKVKHRFIPGIW